MTAPDPSELHDVVELTAREADGYLAGIADRPVRDPSAEEVRRDLRRPAPRAGERRGRDPEGALRRARRGGALGRAEVLPLRGRGDDAGRARRRLAGLDPRPEPGLLGLLAAHQPPGAGRDRLAEGAVRAARGDGRRADHRRDDGELRRARRRAPVVRASGRASTSTPTGWPAAPPITVLGGGYTHPSDVKVMGDAGRRARPACGSSRATTSAASIWRRWRRRSASWAAPRRS